MTEKQFPLVGVCCAAVLKVLHEYLSDELANVLTGEIAKEIMKAVKEIGQEEE